MDPPLKPLVIDFQVNPCETPIWDADVVTVKMCSSGPVQTQGIIWGLDFDLHVNARKTC